MKEKTQKYPRLYINISNKNDFYNLDYYDNQYNNDGTFKVNSVLMSADDFIKENSSLDKLHDLNRIEFQLLDSLIKKQEKVVEIYLNKNKKDQYEVIKSSLDLLLNYKKTFLKWFSDNKSSQ